MPNGNNIIKLSIMEVLIMKIEVRKSPEELGKVAAAYCAEVIGKTIAEKGNARIILSTGASQFEILKAMVNWIFIGLRSRCFTWMNISICLRLTLQASENILKKDL
jgi:hypothetical protein